MRFGTRARFRIRTWLSPCSEGKGFKMYPLRSAAVRGVHRLLVKNNELFVGRRFRGYIGCVSGRAGPGDPLRHHRHQVQVHHLVRGFLFAVSQECSLNYFQQTNLFSVSRQNDIIASQ